MKDHLIDVITDYNTLLHQTITYTDADGNSKTPNFYDVPPYDATAPYIFLVDYIATDASCKDGYTSEVRVTIQVVTQYPAGYGGRKDSSEIVDDVLQALIPGTWTSANFKVITSSLENRTSTVQQDKTHTTIITQLTLRHIVDQV